MQKISLKKGLSFLLVCAFAFSMAAQEAEAKPHDQKPGKAGHHQQKRIHRSCGDIVVDVLNCSKYDFSRACRYNMTLEDYIVSCYIADKVHGHDFERIFRMHKNGKPYKDICKAYGINWGSVRSHVNHNYDIMTRDAAEAGIIMWGLHEVLR